MKKLFMIAMVAMFATVACEKDGDDNGNGNGNTGTKPSIAISVTPAEIAIGAKAVFTVTATKAVEADLTITVKADKEDVLTVPASAMIKKGETTATFEGVAKAAGTAITTITCAEADITTPSATVKVTAPKPEAITFTATAPTLEYSTATSYVEALVNVTLSSAAKGDIEIECNWNFDLYDWANDAAIQPIGVTWSDYPVIIPAGTTEYSFHLIIQPGNAGTLPLMLVSLKGAGANDIEFEPSEFIFVVTK